MAMKYQSMGRSGLMISNLCLGTMIFGEETERGTDELAALRMIDRFLDAGGNFIDTADVYAGGRSEEITGRALRGRRDNVVLATKVRFSIGEAPNHVEEAWQRRVIERNWCIIYVVGQIAETRESTYAQVALAWLSTHPTVASVILGTRTMDQLEDNLGDTNLNLMPDEISRLTQVSAPEEGYPYRMIREYGAR